MARNKGDNAFDDVVDKESDEDLDDSENSPQTNDSESSAVEGDDSNAELTAETSSDTSDSPTTSQSNDEPGSTVSESTSSDSTVQTDDLTEDTSSEKTPSESEPEYPYSDADQHPLYMRSDAWDGLHDSKYYAKGELRKKYGIRNAETRELDEAIAQLVAEKIPPEEIAEKVVEIRGFDP